MYICPCSIPSPYYIPAGSFDFVPRFSLGTSLRMTRRAAGCPRRRVPRKCVISLHNTIPRPARRRRGLIPRTGVITLHNIIPRTACRRGLIPRTGVITLHNTIPRPARCRRGLILRTCFITLSSPLRGQQRCHSEPPRMRRVEESTLATEKRLQCNHARVPSPVISTK